MRHAMAFITTFSLALLLLAAPQALAGSPCKAGAKATVDGTVTKVMDGGDKTWMYINDPAWSCAPIHIVAKGAYICPLAAHVRVSGVLLENDSRNLSDGFSLSDEALASGKGVPYATSYTCVADPAHPDELKFAPGYVAKNKKNNK